MRKKFLVEGMTCASCQAHVERAVGKLPGVKECRVSLLTNSLEVEWEDGAIQEEDILLAVSRGGYRAIPEGEGNKPAKPFPNAFFRHILPQKRQRAVWGRAPAAVVLATGSFYGLTVILKRLSFAVKNFSGEMIFYMPTA